jgi:hypothetical protein
VGALGRSRFGQALLCLLCLAASIGCATTDVVGAGGDAQPSGLSRPERVLVFDFAASPDDVALNRAIPARIARRVAGDETVRHSGGARRRRDAAAH